MIDFFAQFSSINAFKDILVPVSAALGAVWIATRKFKRERIWQDKYSASQRVLGAIEAIRYWGNEMSSDVHMLPSVGDFDGKSSEAFYAAALREVVKQRTVGTLLLSDKFVSKLDDFYAELYKERFSEGEEHYDGEQDAEFGFGRHAASIREISDRYLSQLLVLARKDLGA